MTISSTILAVCSLICTTAYLAAAEPDNWAQSKAREALNQTATGTQPSAAATAAKVSKPATPAPVAHPQAAPVFSTVTTAASATQEEAQRAREVMRQKMNQLHAQQPGPAPPKPMTAPKPAPPPKPAPAPKPAKAPKATPTRKPFVAPPAAVVAQPPAATTPTPTRTPEVSPEERARQQEALRQTLTELEAKEKAAPPTMAKSAEEIRAEKAAAGGEKKRRATEAKAQEQAALEEKKRLAVEAKTQKQAAAEEKKRLAAEAKAQEYSAEFQVVTESRAIYSAHAAEANEEEQKRAAAEAKARQAKGEKPKPTAAPKSSSGFSPLEAPPSQLPASKEDKLADLLRRYKADEITPDEYQTQRARILAEP